MSGQLARGLPPSITACLSVSVSSYYYLCLSLSLSPSLSLQIASFFGVLFISVEIGLAIAIGLAVVIVIWRSAFPRVDLIGRLGSSPVYKAANEFTDTSLMPGVLSFALDSSLYFANQQVGGGGGGRKGTCTVSCIGGASDSAGPENPGRGGGGGWIWDYFLSCGGGI